MIIKSVNLETVCGITSKLPENEFSEFAFAGKSNVGKSSLINGLISRKAYARTSAEPGKTQTINYYKVEYREKSQKEIEAQGLDASYAQEKSNCYYTAIIYRRNTISLLLKILCAGTYQVHDKRNQSGNKSKYRILE